MSLHTVVRLSLDVERNLHIKEMKRNAFKSRVVSSMHTHCDDVSAARRLSSFFISPTISQAHTHHMT